VEPKIGQQSPMSNAAQMTALARTALGSWVEREERRTGSRMVAYEIVASTVGTSADWVRKFLGRSDKAKEPSWTVGWNILTAYQRIIGRVEAWERLEQERSAELKRQIDEVTSRAMEMAESTAGAKAPGKET
jgi:hypothetical protein